MERGRALLTAREREQLQNGASDQRIYEIRSHLRTRINQELATDVEVLETYHPGILEELREVACED